MMIKSRAESSSAPDSSAIQRRVHIIDILLIQPLPQLFHGLTEALEMHHLSGTEELDHIVHIRVVAEAQNVVKGGACHLLCCNGKSATFANKINPIGFILYHIPLKTEYITIFARKIYH